MTDINYVSAGWLLVYKGKPHLFQRKPEALKWLRDNATDRMKYGWWLQYGVWEGRIRTEPVLSIEIISSLRKAGLGTRLTLT